MIKNLSYQTNPRLDMISKNHIKKYNLYVPAENK